jgi:hypothetical protein
LSTSLEQIGHKRRNRFFLCQEDDHVSLATT